MGAIESVLTPSIGLIIALALLGALAIGEFALILLLQQKLRKLERKGEKESRKTR